MLINYKVGCNYMDYSNIKYVKKLIFTSLIFILVIFLVSGAISHMFYQLQMLLKWATIIAVGYFVCSGWGAIVGYNSSMQYKGKIKCLQDDINEMKRKLKR